MRVCDELTFKKFNALSNNLMRKGPQGHFNSFDVFHKASHDELKKAAQPEPSANAQKKTRRQEQEQAEQRNLSSSTRGLRVCMCYTV